MIQDTRALRLDQTRGRHQEASIQNPVKEMAFPARQVFTPFVVVVGCKYFLPVPGCLFFVESDE